MSFTRTVAPVRFEDFGHECFERLVFAYHARTRQWKRIQWRGLGGSDRGRDIFGTTTEGTDIAILCANYRQLKNQKVTSDVDKVLKQGTRPGLIRIVAGGRVSTSLREKWDTASTRKRITVEIWSGTEFEEFLRRDCEALLFRFCEGIPFPDTPGELLALARNADSASDAIRTLHARGSLTDEPVVFSRVTIAAPRPTTATPAISAASSADSERPPAPTVITENPIEIVSIGRQEVLALIATAPISPSRELLARCFPNIPWEAQVESLARSSLLIEDANGHLVVSKSVGDRLLSEPADARSVFENRWVDALMQHDRDPSALVAIALIRIRQKKLTDATALLVERATSIESSDVAKTYLAFFEPVVRVRLAELPPKLRVESLDLLGKLLVSVARFDDSIAVYDKLRRYAQQIGNRWGVTQSYINAGVAFAKSDRNAEAIAAYHKAIKWARRTRDDQTLGRALTNLASLTISQDPRRALKLMLDGAAAKMRAGDVSGFAASLCALGNLAMHQEDYRNAEHFYNLCVSAANDIDARYLLSLALHNLGKVHLSTGRPAKAIGFFQAARRVATDESIVDAITTTTTGLAVGLLECRRWDEAERMFVALLDCLPIHAVKRRVAAISDVATCQSRQGKFAEARQMWNKALELASHAPDIDAEMAASIHMNIARTLVKEGLRTSSMSLLTQRASVEARRHSYSPAARLWKMAADTAYQADANDPDTARMLSRASSCLAKLPQRSPLELSIQMSHYAWLRDQRKDEAAVGILRAAIATARILGSTYDLTRALDELGCTLQRIGDFESARRAHSESLALARAAGDSEMIDLVSGNLGLLFLRLGRPRRALTILRTARKSAMRRNDLALGGILAGNEAIALLSMKLSSEAVRLIRSTQARLTSPSLWHERLFLLECEAKYLLEKDRPLEAAQKYSSAITTARRHGIRPSTSSIADFSAAVAQLKKDHAPPADLRRLRRQARRCTEA